MNLSALRRHVRKILTEGTQGITLDFSKSKNAERLGIKDLSITDTDALDFLNQTIGSFRRKGVTFDGDIEATIDSALTVLDGDSYDAVRKGNAFGGGFFATLIACADTANGGEGFMPSDKGIPMVIISKTGDNPGGLVKDADDVAQYINDVQTKMGINISGLSDLKKIAMQVENGLDSKPFSPTEYKMSMGLPSVSVEAVGSTLTVSYEMLADAFKSPLSFSRQKAEGFSGAKSAIEISRLADSARYIMPGEAGGAENYKKFLEAAVNCFKMTPVISAGIFGGISPTNADVANEWQLATLLRFVARKEEADFNDAVSEAILHIGLAAGIGGMTYGGARGARKSSIARGKEKLTMRPRATSPGDVEDPQFLNKILGREDVKAFLKERAATVQSRIQQYETVTAELSARLASNSERVARAARLRSVGGSSADKIEAYENRSAEVLADLDDLRRAMGGLPARPRPAPDPTDVPTPTITPGGAPTPPAPSGGPIPPSVGAPAPSRSTVTGRQVIASYDKELEKLEQSIERQRQAAAELAAEVELGTVNPILGEAELASLSEDLKLSRAAVLDAKKFLAKSSEAQVQQIIDEDDAAAILAILGIPKSYGGISALGWVTVYLAVSATQTLLLLQGEGMNDAMAQLSPSSKVVFALLTMTQEEYISSEELLTGPINDLTSEMKGSRDENYAREYIMDVRAASGDEIGMEQAENIRQRILKMVEASTSLDSDFDYAAVRDGYLACLEALGQREVPETTPSPEEIKRSVGPKVRVKAGTGIDMPDVERR